MPSSYFILCRPLLLLPSIFPIFGVFSSESALQIRWPKYWSFCFNISPSNEHSGMTFRMDWLDLLAVQGTPKSLLQHHSSKASIFRCSASFIVQLSHPYMTTGKTIALTRQTFVGKVMSLLFNIKENTHTQHIYTHTHNTYIYTPTHTHTRASLVAHLGKNPRALQETWVQSVGWEDPLEEGKATHSSILAWRIPWTIHGVAKSPTQLSSFHFTSRLHKMR